MSKTTPPALVKTLAMALVLCDMPGEGLKAGSLVQAHLDSIVPLKGQGIVDDNDAAVSHALSQGAKVQRLASDLRAEAEAAAAAQASADGSAPDA